MARNSSTPQLQETETQGPVQGKETIGGGGEVHQEPVQGAVGQQQGKIVTDVWQEIAQQPQLKETETQGPVHGKGRWR